MAEKKNLLTDKGLKKLEDELQELRVVKRKEVAQKIKEAREQGDLSENAEYDAAKDEQKEIEARIEELESILKNVEIVYTDEQFAAMARCLNTIGNYSTNPAKESHYNINACYNAIRPDLDYLCRTGVFDFYYPDREKVTDKKGDITAKSPVTNYYRDTTSWQSMLQKIVNAHNVQQDVPIDVYNDNIQKYAFLSEQ